MQLQLCWIARIDAAKASRQWNDAKWEKAAAAQILKTSEDQAGRSE